MDPHHGWRSPGGRSHGLEVVSHGALSGVVESDGTDLDGGSGKEDCYLLQTLCSSGRGDVEAICDDWHFRFSCILFPVSLGEDGGEETELNVTVFKFDIVLQRGFDLLSMGIETRFGIKSNIIGTHLGLRTSKNLLSYIFKFFINNNL